MKFVCSDAMRTRKRPIFQRRWDFSENQMGWRKVLKILRIFFVNMHEVLVETFELSSHDFKIDCRKFRCSWKAKLWICLVGTVGRWFDAFNLGNCTYCKFQFNCSESTSAVQIRGKTRWTEASDALCTFVLILSLQARIERKLALFLSHKKKQVSCAEVPLMFVSSFLRGTSSYK